MIAFGGDVQSAVGQAPLLVVDDDPDILGMIQEALEIEGYSVVTAADGQEALERLEGVTPAAILLDMRMPRMNGWEFARAARERGVAAPIIVVTAASNAREWAAEISAEAFLAKPFTIDDLLAAVKPYQGRSS